MRLFVNILYSNKFRTAFKIVDRSKLRWYPGHMHTGLKTMQRRLKTVDCVVEVHDARIPLSGRNPNFEETITGPLKPHILVLNKVDLTDPSLVAESREMLKKHCASEVIFTNCKDKNCKGITKLIEVLQDTVVTSNRYNRAEEPDMCALIIGVPNVGKSSLINRLRNKFLKKSSAVAVGAAAGITKSVGTKVKISEDPLLYMYDTPGISTPSIPDIEVGMKLALCATFKDTEVGMENIADYLLYWLNKHEAFRYVDFLNLKHPTDDIKEVLTVSAFNLNYFMTRKEFGGSGGYSRKPDLNKAAYNFVYAFRKGTLGTFNLDCDFLIN